MINNRLDDIIKCEIDISNPSVANLSVDEFILVVVPAPAEGEEYIEMGEIVSAKDLLKVGFARTDVAYKVANVAFEQKPSPRKIFYAVRKSDESVEEVMAKVAAKYEFYGIYFAKEAIKATEGDTEYFAIANYAEDNEKIFGFEIDNMDAVSLDVFEGGFFRTFAAKGNEPIALAMMAKCFGYDSGSETWAMQELTGIEADSLTDAQKATLDAKNVSTFLRYADSNIVIGGKVLAGEWIDVIRFRDWLKKKIQLTVFNVFKANIKVPYNDNGISLIEGAINKVLSEGQTRGGITTNKYDEDGNVTYAYTVTVPEAGALDEAVRKSRTLSGVTYTAQLSGAIHMVEIHGYLTF